MINRLNGFVSDTPALLVAGMSIIRDYVPTFTLLEYRKSYFYSVEQIAIYLLLKTQFRLS